MTKKDFILIAATLKSLKPDADGNWNSTCRAFADMCASQNPRFDRQKFLDACGVAR